MFYTYDKIFSAVTAFVFCCDGKPSDINGC